MPSPAFFCSLAPPGQTSCTPIPWEPSAASAARRTPSRETASPTPASRSTSPWSPKPTPTSSCAPEAGLDKDEFFGSLSDTELTYATLGGEYRGRQGFWQSGIYLALGAYRLEGTRFFQDEEETSWGLSLGVTGELPINRTLGVQAEVSGHYVDFDDFQFFAMAHAGLVVHF